MKPAPEPPEEFNPYAPPQASLTRPATGSRPVAPSSRPCWRQGNIVFLAHDSQLPPRCIRCNEPASLPLAQRRISVTPRHREMFHYGLCPHHTRRRRLTLGLTALAFLAAVFIRLQSTEPPGSRWYIENLLFVGSVLSGVFHSRLLVPVWVGAKVVAIKGCRPPFLDSLPESSPPSDQP